MYINKKINAGNSFDYPFPIQYKKQVKNTKKEVNWKKKTFQVKLAQTIYNFRIQSLSNSLKQNINFQNDISAPQNKKSKDLKNIINLKCTGNQTNDSSYQMFLIDKQEIEINHLSDPIQQTKSSDFLRLGHENKFLFEIIPRDCNQNFCIFEQKRRKPKITNYRLENQIQQELLQNIYKSHQDIFDNQLLQQNIYESIFQEQCLNKETPLANSQSIDNFSENFFQDIEKFSLDRVTTLNNSQSNNFVQFQELSNTFFLSQNEFQNDDILDCNVKGSFFDNFDLNKDKQFQKELDPIEFEHLYEIMQKPLSILKREKL